MVSHIVDSLINKKLDFSSAIPRSWCNISESFEVDVKHAYPQPELLRDDIRDV